jgi:hypothetical protein
MEDLKLRAEQTNAIFKHHLDYYGFLYLQGKDSVMSDSCCGINPTLPLSLEKHDSD